LSGQKSTGKRKGGKGHRGRDGGENMGGWERWSTESLVRRERDEKWNCGGQGKGQKKGEDFSTISERESLAKKKAKKKDSVKGEKEDAGTVVGNRPSWGARPKEEGQIPREGASSSPWGKTQA